METNRSVSEAVAVGGDDSTLAARKELAAIRHPGAAAHLGESETDELTEGKPTGRTPGAGAPLNQSLGFCLTAVYLVKLGTLDEVDGRLALLALQPQYVVRVAPAQDGRPLDVCAVHAADTCRAASIKLMESAGNWADRPLNPDFLPCSLL